MKKIEQHIPRRSQRKKAENKQNAINNEVMELSKKNERKRINKNDSNDSQRNSVEKKIIKQTKKNEKYNVIKKGRKTAKTKKMLTIQALKKDMAEFNQKLKALKDEIVQKRKEIKKHIIKKDKKIIKSTMVSSTIEATYEEF